MTKAFKIWLMLLVIIAISVGAYLIKINTSSQSSSLQTGYSLYQKGDAQAAFAQFSQYANEDPQAAFALAMMYWDGIGVAKNPTTAADWLIKSANANNKSALYNLGFFRYNSIIPDNKEDVNGLISLNRAADLGVIEAQELLGGIYLKDKHQKITQDIQLSRKYFTAAAEKESNIAKFALAVIAHQYDKDSKTAVDLLIPLVSKDFPFPAMLLETIYREGGNGVNKNREFANKYEAISSAALSNFSPQEINIEPTALSLYGSQTVEEQLARVSELEALAIQGDNNAIYSLFNQFIAGEGVPRSQAKALAYLQPLVNQKDPKARYLHYMTTKSSVQYLLDAAKADYPDAVFTLSKIYSGTYYEPNIKYDPELAEKYLLAAADLGHQEALIKVINNSLRDYDFPSKKLNNRVTQYTLKMLDEYPDSPSALMTASYVYENENSEIYSLVKAFDLNKRASELSQSREIKAELAYKYAYALGTEQDLPKGAALLKQSIIEDDSLITAKQDLIELYYHYDISAVVDEDFIVTLLKTVVDDNEQYEVAHYYADYLLQQDAVKNIDKAFELYQQANKYSASALIHYASALLKYKTGQEDKAFDAIISVLSSKGAQTELTEKDLNQAYAILIDNGIDNIEAKKLIVELALVDNNLQAQKRIQPLVGIDGDITYHYGMTKLSQITDINAISESELKSYFDLILKSAELGNQKATMYIIRNLDNVNYVGEVPYYKAKFKALTGLKQDDIIFWYNKCANLGSYQCLYDLGEIYQKGKYGLDADYKIALSYFNRIDDPDFSFLKWRLEEIEKATKEFEELEKSAKKGDAKAIHTLAYAFKVGNYGQKRDQQKWFSYLEKSAKLGNELALKDSIEHYSQDTLINANKAKILGYYDQLVTLGSEDYSRKLAKQYLVGSPLVEPNREKAREYYIKAGSWGEQYIEYMDKFDLNLQIADESSTAKYNLGSAYLYGNGIKADILKAKDYLKRASEEGNDLAIYRYAELMQKGHYDKTSKQWVILPDWQEAIVWLKKYSKQKRVADDIAFYESTVSLALNGDTTAYLLVAEWYRSKGQYNAAEIWYRKSLDAGNLAAVSLIDAITEDESDKYQLYLLGAEKGDLYSKIKLSWLSLQDINIPTHSEKYNEAVATLNQGLTSDNIEASKLAFDVLAKLYGDGIESKDDQVIHPKNIEKYIELLNSESKRRNQASRLLFAYYANSEPEKALGYLQIAYDRGDLSAIEEFYQFYSPGRYCQNKNIDMDKAERYLSEWLAKGEFRKNNDRYFINIPESRTSEMGDIYLEGSCDVTKDIDKAIEWYKTSLKYQDTHALPHLYKAYIEKGDIKEAYYYALILEMDPAKIAQLESLSDAERKTVETRFAEMQAYQQYGRYAEDIEKQRLQAEAGDAAMAFSLAVSYARGERVPEDSAKMIYFYELSGKQGYARAYNILGNLYRRDNERGIEVDAEKALYYFDLGAQLNDSNTAHLAGDMLYLGKELTPDYPRAAKYYEITELEQGTHHALAKYKLAYMYYNGLVGTQSIQDIQKSYDYLQLAAKYQDKLAIDALKKWDFSKIQK